MPSLEDFKADHFDRVWELLCAADIPELEKLTVRSPFPRGMDGWLGRRWLTTAIDTGNTDAVTWVLSKKPQINYIDDEGFTALMSALHVEIDCRHNADEAAQLTICLIDLLCDAGADINLAASLGQTALHWAASNSSPAVVRHLLQRGADPNLSDWDFVPEKPAACAKDLERWDVYALLKDAMNETSSE